MQRRTFLSLPLAVLASCSRKPELTTIQVLARPQFQISGLYLAQEKGYFAAEGIQIEIAEADGSRAMVPLLSEGKADVGFSGMSPAVTNARARGADFRIVASRGMYSNECPDNRRVFGSRAAFPNGFTSLQQLRGKRVGYGARIQLGEYIWDLALLKAGIKPHEVTLIDMEDRQAALMVASGQIDVAFNAADEIRFTSLINEVVPGPSFSDFAPEWMYSFVFFGKGLITGDPDRGIRFLRAFLKGHSDFAGGENPQYFLEYMRKNKMNEQLLTVCRKEFQTGGRVRVQDIQALIDWAADKGYVPTRIPATELVDLRFLQSL